MFYGRPEVGDDIYPLVETQSYLRGVNIVDPFHEKAGAFEHPQAIAGLKTLHHYAVGGVMAVLSKLLMSDMAVPSSVTVWTTM